MTKRKNEAFFFTASRDVPEKSGCTMKSISSKNLFLHGVVPSGCALLAAGTLAFCLFCGAAPAAAGQGSGVASYSPSATGHIHQHDGSVGRSHGAAAHQSRHRGRGHRKDVQQQKALHGSPWAFGRGADLGWKKGLDGSKLQQKATARGLHASPEREAATLAPQKPQDSGMHFDIDHEEQNWSYRKGRVDEDVAMGSSHRVRALAGVREDDVSFGVGPEVVVRDNDQVHQNYAKTDQPDVQPGVGMQMQVNF